MLPTVPSSGRIPQWIRWSPVLLRQSEYLSCAWGGFLSHIVFTVVDVHLICPALMTNPLQTGQRLGGVLCWGWELAVSGLVPALCPASLPMENINKNSVTCQTAAFLWHKMSFHFVKCKKGNIFYFRKVSESLLMRASRLLILPVVNQCS